MEDWGLIINRAICRLRVELKTYINQVVGGSSSYVDDVSEPAMSQLELGSYVGGTDKIIYLTDRTDAKKWAVFNPYDETSNDTANQIIIDGNGNRWYIMSQREFATRISNNYSPFE